MKHDGNAGQIEMYEKYYEYVFRFLRGLSLDEQLAEELTQETFYRALNSVNSFKGDSDIGVWLCSIAKNLFFTHQKKRKRLDEDVDLDTLEADETSFTRIIEDKETALLIHKVLHNLKEPYKEIFSLRIFGELSFAEIGALFGKSEHWACVTYHRAKEMIQAAMQRM